MKLPLDRSAVLQDMHTLILLVMTLIRALMLYLCLALQVISYLLEKLSFTSYVFFFHSAHIFQQFSIRWYLFNNVQQRNVDFDYLKTS